jgi:hypothetical protein
MKKQKLLRGKNNETGKDYETNICKDENQKIL